MKNKHAFTLAEVLITLGVIGVVAALTMPSLIVKHQKQVAATSLKSTYSKLLQATKMYEADNALPLEQWDTSLEPEEFLSTYIAPYVQVIKECNSISDCYVSTKPLYLNRKTEINFSLHILVLKDGTFVGVTSHTVGGRLFYIDINGAKGPNYAGRDIFYFYLVNTDISGDNVACTETFKTIKSGLYPGGIGDSCRIFSSYTREELLGTSIHRSCNPTNAISKGEGDACAAVIMLDGWEIKDDYPW